MVEKLVKKTLIYFMLHVTFKNRITFRNYYYHWNRAKLENIIIFCYTNFLLSPNINCSNDNALKLIFQRK